MGKSTIADKNSKKELLDKALSKLPKKRKAIDVKKYFGKIDFGVSGLEYQLKVRDEWR